MLDGVDVFVFADETLSVMKLKICLPLSMLLLTGEAFNALQSLIAVNATKMIIAHMMMFHGNSIIYPLLHQCPPLSLPEAMVGVVECVAYCIVTSFFLRVLFSLRSSSFGTFFSSPSFIVKKQYEQTCECHC